MNKTTKKTKKTTLKDVTDMIAKWQKQNDVMFFGGFVTFNKDFDIIEDRLVAYGDKKSIQLSMKDLGNFIKDEKEDFINL